MASKRSTACLRICLVIFAVASALCVSGPALYWKFKKNLTLSSSCAPYCGKGDPELNKEMRKQFVDLLTEELKLQEAVAAEHAHHMNVTITDAKRLALQYQNEAEKCNAATETCEEARERAEAALTKERKITHIWEQRARKNGWQDA